MENTVLSIVRLNVVIDLKMSFNDKFCRDRAGFSDMLVKKC